MTFRNCRFGTKIEMTHHLSFQYGQQKNCCTWTMECIKFRIFASSTSTQSVSRIWIVVFIYIFCTFTYISSLTAPIYYSKYPQYKLFHQLTVSIRINFYRRLLRSSYFHYVFFVHWFAMGSWRQKSEHEIKLATTKWSNQRTERTIAFFL